jgi:broad specificity phosphatase PhoE
VGDYNLSPGEHGGSQYILSPGHESEDEEEEDEDLRIDGEEGKDFLAALREEEDDGDARAKRMGATTSTGQVALAATKKHKRMAVLNNQPSLEVDGNGKIISNVGGNKSRVFFPIFSKGQKTVHLVRHGQSTYNEAISGPGSWEEPKIFDARLTELGIKQAKELGKFLSELPKDAVWITSPLTRAMETCVYGREAMYAFTSSSLATEAEKNSPDENAAPTNNNDSNNINSDGNITSNRRSLSASSRKKASTKKKVATLKDQEEERENAKQRHETWGRSVIVRPEITEKLSCSGDIGRTKLELIEDIPIFAQSLSKLPDKSWWWDTNEKRNDAAEKMFNSNEPTRVFQRRVNKFKQWILSHPSTTFVVFGHSTFFKEMVGRSLKNCEVASIQL